MRYDYTYGTAHFATRQAIMNAYACTLECADDMIREGVVHLGAPTIKPDETIVLRTNGRYYLEVWVD